MFHNITPLANLVSGSFQNREHGGHQWKAHRLFKVIQSCFSKIQERKKNEKKKRRKKKITYMGARREKAERRELDVFYCYYKGLVGG